MEGTSRVIMAPTLTASEARLRDEAFRNGVHPPQRPPWRPRPAAQAEPERRASTQSHHAEPQEIYTTTKVILQGRLVTPEAKRATEDKAATTATTTTTTTAATMAATTATTPTTTATATATTATTAAEPEPETPIGETPTSPRRQGPGDGGIKEVRPPYKLLPAAEPSEESEVSSLCGSEVTSYISEREFDDEDSDREHGRVTQFEMLERYQAFERAATDFWGVPDKEMLDETVIENPPFFGEKQLLIQLVQCSVRVPLARCIAKDWFSQLKRAGFYKDHQWKDHTTGDWYMSADVHMRHIVAYVMHAKEKWVTAGCRYPLRRYKAFADKWGETALTVDLIKTIKGVMQANVIKGDKLLPLTTRQLRVLSEVFLSAELLQINNDTRQLIYNVEDRFEVEIPQQGSVFFLFLTDDEERENRRICLTADQHIRGAQIVKQWLRYYTTPTQQLRHTCPIIVSCLAAATKLNQADETVLVRLPGRGQGRFRLTPFQQIAAGSKACFKFETTQDGVKEPEVVVPPEKVVTPEVVIPPATGVIHGLQSKRKSRFSDLPTRSQLTRHVKGRIDYEE